MGTDRSKQRIRLKRRSANASCQIASPQSGLTPVGGRPDSPREDLLEEDMKARTMTRRAMRKKKILDELLWFFVFFLIPVLSLVLMVALHEGWRF